MAPLTIGEILMQVGSCSFFSACYVLALLRIPFLLCLLSSFAIAACFPHLLCCYEQTGTALASLQAVRGNSLASLDSKLLDLRMRLGIAPRDQGHGLTSQQYRAGLAELTKQHMARCVLLFSCLVYFISFLQCCHADIVLCQFLLLAVRC